MYTCQSSTCDSVCNVWQGTQRRQSARRKAAGLLQRSGPQSQRRCPLRKVAAASPKNVLASLCLIRLMLTWSSACAPSCVHHHVCLLKSNSLGTLGAHDGRQCSDCRLQCVMLSPSAGIVVTANTARQAMATSAAQPAPAKPPRAAPEPTKEAPVQRRAVALPKPLASKHLRPDNEPHSTGAQHCP